MLPFVLVLPESDLSREKPNLQRISTALKDMFKSDLKPVHEAAQERVPVPEGLDLGQNLAVGQGDVSISSEIPGALHVPFCNVKPLESEGSPKVWLDNYRDAPSQSVKANSEDKLNDPFYLTPRNRKTRLRRFDWKWYSNCEA